MNVTHFHRRPGHGHFSVERMFEDIRMSLPPSVTVSVCTCRFESKGIVKRLYNTAEASFRRSDVNHVTGDVHYLSFGLPGRATIVTVLDCVSLHEASKLRHALLRAVWYDWALLRPVAVTTISDFSRRELLRLTRCNPRKVVVIPACVSPEFLPFRQEFNADRPTVLQVGTAPNKNVDRLVAAISGLRCRLHIVGTPSKSQWTAIRGGNIDCTVSERLSRSELVDAYKGADIVAFVSTYEGFGLPIVEANAVGRVVVTSDCCSMPEIAGSAACQVNPLDIGSIRTGIVSVIRDASYRRELVEAGFANARRFNPKIIASQYAALYESVANTSGMPSERAVT